MVSPDAAAASGRFCAESLDTASVTEFGDWACCACCSWGMLAADRARWMAAAEGTVEVGVDRAGARWGLVSWLLCLERNTPALVCTDEAGGVPCCRMAERTGEGFLDDLGLSDVKGTNVAEACFRRVGMEDMDVDEACRTVTGLLSLLDALGGADGVSAMV